MGYMKKGYQAILLSAVMMCAVFTFVTIAWATFNTTLKIGGQATVKAQTWNIYFSSAEVDSTNTTASNVAIDSIGSSTSTVTLSSLAAEYDTPGEKAVYNIQIKSSSTFDAKLTKYDEPEIKCTSADTPAGTYYTPTTGLAAYSAVTDGDYSGVDSAARVCAFITYEYVVATGGYTGVKMGGSPSVAAGTTVKSLENTLILDKVGTTGGDTDIDLVLTIYFDKNKGLSTTPTALPTKDVTVTFNNLKTTFTQA